MRKSILSITMFSVVALALLNYDIKQDVNENPGVNLNLTLEKSYAQAHVPILVNCWDGGNYVENMKCIACFKDCIQNGTKDGTCP